MTEALMEKATFSGLCRIMEGKDKTLLAAVGRAVKFSILYGAGLLGPEAAAMASAVNAAKDSGLLERGIEAVLNRFSGGQDGALEKARTAHVMMVFSAYFDAFQKGQPEDYAGIELEADEKLKAAEGALKELTPDQELVDYDLELDFGVDGLPSSYTRLEEFYGLLTEKLTTFIGGLRYIEAMKEQDKERLYAFLRKLPRLAVEEFHGQYMELSARYKEFFAYGVHSKLDGISYGQTEMLQEVRDIRNSLNEPGGKPQYMLDRGWSEPEYFVPGSRDRELAQCEELLTQRGQVYLYGLGGIGKTETAIQLARRLPNCYLIHYKGNMEDTILSMRFSGYQYKPTPGADFRQEDVNNRLDILKDHYSDAVLIVDNFDDADRSLDDLRCEDAFRRLCGLGIRLVLTTRSEAGGEGVEILPLEEEQLRTMMAYHLRDTALSPEDEDALIQAAGRHTLLLTLIAKTLRESEGDVTAGDILDALRKSTLSEQDFPEVTSDQNRSREQKQLFAHLSALFDVSKLGETARRVMAFAALLPDGGMEQGLLRACLDREEKKMLRSLRNRGWLGKNGTLYLIHPAVREVCIEELKPSDESCGAFLVKLGEQYDEMHYDHVRYGQLADTFRRASQYLQDQRGDWAHHAGVLYDKLGDYFAALEQNELCLTRSIAAFGEEHSETATACNNLGYTYGNLGNHQKALEFLEQALVIKKRLFGPENLELATLYNNMGRCYNQLGNHKKALEFQEQALTIREKALPLKHPELAISYNDVGVTYSNLGDHEKALRFKKKAMEIWKEVLPSDHPNLAISFDNVGTSYGDMGDYNMALKYQEQALTIREKVLPLDHLDFAASYNNMGTTHSKLGDHKTALKYQEMALSIIENALPWDHPKLATSYHNVAFTCHELGDYDRELELLKKAVAIREKKLPAGHPDLLNTCLGLAMAYAAKGDMEQAAHWFLKAQPPES